MVRYFIFPDAAFLLLSACSIIGLAFIIVRISSVPTWKRKELSTDARQVGHFLYKTLLQFDIAETHSESFCSSFVSNTSDLANLCNDTASAPLHGNCSHRVQLGARMVSGALYCFWKMVGGALALLRPQATGGHPATTVL